MIPIKQADIPAKVTVESTSKNFLELIDTTLPADLTSSATKKLRTSIECYADGGDIRYTLNPEHEPDATTGFVLKDGETRIFEGLSPEELKFYADSDTTMQILVGRI